MSTRCCANAFSAATANTCCPWSCPWSLGGVAVPSKLRPLCLEGITWNQTWSRAMTAMIMLKLAMMTGSLFDQLQDANSDKLLWRCRSTSALASTKSFSSCCMPAARLRLAASILVFNLSNALLTRSICGITCRRAGAPPEYYSLAGPRCDWQQIQQTVHECADDLGCLIHVRFGPMEQYLWTRPFGSRLAGFAARAAPAAIQEAAEANLQDARGCLHPCAIERQTHPTSFHVGRWTT